MASRRTAKAFRTYCRASGIEPSRGKISYTKLRQGLKRLAKSSKAYENLTFRYHVVARPIGQLEVGPSKALALAEATDAEEMLYFMRSLDEDDQAFVTHESFCNVMAGKATGSTSRWAKVKDAGGVETSSGRL